MKQLQGILLLFAFISVYPQQDTCLVLSEIMFIPQPGNNEFVEIYNSSSTDTINLNGFKIKYYTSAADVITDAGWGTMLPPLSYAVVLEGDYDFTQGIYNNIIPSQALKVKISDNAFGGTGMSNTSGRPVTLLDTVSSIVDMRFYTADNASGYSEEKIVLNHDSLNTNWLNSEVYNGTPGKRNSVSYLNYDLAVITMSTSPSVPVSGQDLVIRSLIKNKGSNNAASFFYSLFNDINFDSIPAPEELIFSSSYYNLNSGDSLNAESVLFSPDAGMYNFIAKVSFEPDEDTLNNMKFLRLIIYQENELCDIVINELMYAPVSGMPEWIELYNRSGAEVNLRNRKISDNTSSAYITRQDLFLPPDSFLVLSKDSSILNYYNISSRLIVLSSLPSLNNSGDDIVIKDSAGIHFDSLSYLPEWGGTSGRSLERVSSETPSNISSNWGSSESMYKGTPGWLNSLTSREYDLKVNSFGTIPEYGVMGEGILIKAVVKNSGTNTSGNYTLRFYSDLNKDSIAQLSELFFNMSGLPLPALDSAIHLFTFENFFTGTNYLIAVVETLTDEDLSNNTAFVNFMGVNINEVRNDLVINEFIFAPHSPEPEWIEIFNKSSKTIEFKNYQLADNRDTVKTNSSSLLICPLEYLVIASDSSILNHYKIDAHLLISNIPSLNNTGDKIILLDSLGRIIDSLEYRQSWGVTGKSVEKISPAGLSVDSSNWAPTLSKNKGTPGYINSVTEKEFDIKVTSVRSIPPYPVKGDNVSLQVNILNNGSRPAEFSLMLYSDTDLDSIPDHILENTAELLLLSSDSLSYNFTYHINGLDKAYGFFISAAAESDQDTSNNYLYLKVFPGYSPGTVVINEIMYSPEGGEPEWIELYNKQESKVDISGWEISDIFATPSKVKLKEDLHIKPYGCYVISKDSLILNYHREIPSGFAVQNLPAFNNDRDGVILKDNRGQTMDSLTYLSSWGGKNGFSLERKSTSDLSNNPFNWNSSRDIEKSTPGRLNSITIKQHDIAVTNLHFNPRFPVKGDDVYISAQLKNYGTAATGICTINFYSRIDSIHFEEDLLYTTTISDLEPEDSLYITSPVIIPAIVKRYKIRIESIYEQDQENYNNNFEKTIEPGIAAGRILVNEIMYAPEAGKPEWIEFINTSEDTLDLMEWKIEDISSGNIITISPAGLFISPGEYFLITSDSSFKYFYPDVTCRIIFLNIPALGNTSDGIIVYDFRHGIIDSMFYKSMWGGKNGQSLERISVSVNSADSSNWISCLWPEKSTPGRGNSVSGIRAYSRNEVIINEILAEPDIDNCEFIELYNVSGDSINIGGWKIYDEKGNFSRIFETSYMLPPDAYFVLAADSVIFSRYSLTNAHTRILNLSNLGLVNTGELILLKDVRGNIIDSVIFSEKWHNKTLSSYKNISLERISPFIGSNEKTNWSSAVTAIGATPGTQNSIHCAYILSNSDISVSPNPFSPDNDSFEDHCIISYSLSKPVSTVRIKIFDSRGRLIRTLINNYSSGSSGSFIFDGLNDDGESLRIGIYIILLEAATEGLSVPEVLKTVVVIARRLG